MWSSLLLRECPGAVLYLSKAESRNNRIKKSKHVPVYYLAGLATTCPDLVNSLLNCLANSSSTYAEKGEKSFET